MEDRDILLLLKINGFTVERANLLLDFVESITQKIIKTYLGDTLMTTEDKRKHFDWCWKKTVENFKSEGVNFEDNEDLREYFLKDG